MGMSELPSLEMYCSFEHDNLAPSLVRKVMARNRFSQLLQCFHVNAIDPLLVTCLPTYNRHYKVQKLLNLSLSLPIRN